MYDRCMATGAVLEKSSGGAQVLHIETTPLVVVYTYAQTVSTYVGVISVASVRVVC